MLRNKVGSCSPSHARSSLFGPAPFLQCQGCSCTTYCPLHLSHFTLCPGCLFGTARSMLVQVPSLCAALAPISVGARRSRKNSGSHIDASHSRQPLVKGERLVRYEVNAVMLEGSRVVPLRVQWVWAMSHRFGTHGGFGPTTSAFQLARSFGFDACSPSSHSGRSGP